MLGGVCWLWVVIETREWEQSGWLCFCVFPRRVSAALERKEVRTVSNVAIRLVILLPCFGSRWTWKKFWVKEEEGRGEAGKVTLREDYSSFTLQSKIKLHLSRDFLLLGDLWGVRTWCIYTTTLVKQCKELYFLTSLCTWASPPEDTESVKTSSGIKRRAALFTTVSFSSH